MWQLLWQFTQFTILQICEDVARWCQMKSQGIMKVIMVLYFVWEPWMSAQTFVPIHKVTVEWKLARWCYVKRQRITKICLTHPFGHLLPNSMAYFSVDQHCSPGRHVTSMGENTKPAHCVCVLLSMEENQASSGQEHPKQMHARSLCPMWSDLVSRNTTWGFLKPFLHSYISTKSGALSDAPDPRVVCQQ